MAPHLVPISLLPRHGVRKLLVERSSSMSSTVSGVIAWPLIMFMVIIVVARYRWFNNNLYGVYLNNTLALALLAQLLHEHFVQNMLSMAPADAQQLYGTVVGFVGTEFIGFTLLWTGLSPAETRQRHRCYRLAALVLCAAYLICGTRARTSQSPLNSPAAGTAWQPGPSA